MKVSGIHYRSSSYALAFQLRNKIFLLAFSVNDTGRLLIANSNHRSCMVSSNEEYFNFKFDFFFWLLFSFFISFDRHVNGLVNI